MPVPSRLSISPDRYRRITLIALVLLSFIIVTGAAVRLSGSGLGCSDWPTCEQDRLVAEVHDVHAMVEFVNRVITGLVSVAVTAAVLGSMWRTPRRRDLTLWSWGLVAGVIAQILLGALVVREHLPPTLVMGHFLVSMLLVWNAVVLHHRAGIDDEAFAARPVARPLPHPVGTHVRFLSVLATAVLVTGTIVTGAGPHSGSETEETKDALAASGVDVSQLSLSDLEVERLPWEVPDVARIHGITVMAFLAGVLWLALRLRRDGSQRLLDAIQALLVLVVVQGGIGYVQYFTGVPVLLVGVHVAGATAVWIAMMRLHLACGLAAHWSGGSSDETDHGVPDDFAGRGGRADGRDSPRAGSAVGRSGLE